MSTTTPPFDHRAVYEAANRRKRDQRDVVFRLAAGVPTESVFKEPAAMTDHTDFIAEAIARSEARTYTPARIDADTAMRWRPADLVEAHSQVVATMAGRKPAGELHPIAADMLRDGRAPSLVDMARAALVNVIGTSARSMDPRNVLGHAIGTSHLASVLVDAANNVILERQGDLLAKVLKVTRGVEVKDYRPATVATVELDAELPQPAANFHDWNQIAVTGAAESLQLGSTPLRIRFSEYLTVNDDVDALLRTTEAALVAAAQNEVETAFGLLDTNNNLSDGAAWFAAGVNIAAAVGDPNAASLNAAINALRSQLVNGKYSDCDPRYLLCASSLESTARDALRDMYGDTGEVEVVATSYLSGDAWYLMADPASWPTLVRGTARGSQGVSLRFGPGNPNDREGVRDVILEGLHTCAFAPVSRVGIVKVPAS